MKAKRAVLTPAIRAEAAHQISEILWGWLQSRPEHVIGVYLSLSVEPSLDALLPHLWRSGRTVVAPRVDVENERMRFWRLDSLDEVVTGAWNVREPKGREMLLPELVLVPGLAFDVNGGRLGMGGGWYDRVLADIPLKIGVCFECQLVPHVPREPHDVRVDWIANEKYLFEPHAAEPAGAL